jgi:hypothetical protein
MMSFKEYHQVLAILALIKGHVVPITHEPDIDIQGAGDRVVKRILEFQTNAMAIYDAHLEDPESTPPAFPPGLGELVYKAVIKVQLTQSLMVLVFNIGVRKADRYFFCNTLYYSPHTPDSSITCGFIEELI